MSAPSATQLLAGHVGGAVGAAGAARLDRSGVERLQQRLLERLLQTSYDQVSACRESWTAAGFGTAAPRPADLQRLPVITKTDLRALPEQAIHHPFWGRHARASFTSGTSGEPLRILHDLRSAGRLDAVWMRSHAAYGLRPWHRTVYFRNLPAPKGVAERLGLFRSYHLPVDADLSTVRATIRQRRPQVLGGYPSHLVDLLGRLPDAEPRSFGVRWITTGSENLPDGTRERLAAAFGAQVVNLYGSAEFGCIAFQCRRGALHLNEDTVLAEVHVDGAPVADGEVGELVLTGLWSRAMPLVRYRSGDQAAIDPRRCGCGNPFRVLTGLYGRSDVSIVGPDGVRHTAVRLCEHVKRIAAVRQYQVEQLDRTHAVVRIVVDPAAPTADTVAQAVAVIGRELGDGFEVSGEAVATIEPLANGKVPDVVPWSP